MIRTGWKYRVRFVDHKTTRDGNPYVTFQVGHKIKSSDTNAQAQYWNVRVTVYEDLPLLDGDEIVMGTIRSVECAEYKGRMYYNMVVEGVSVGHQDERTTVPKGQADDDIALPFDLD